MMENNKITSLLEMENIFKSFSTVKVLKDVALSVNYGEVHGLMGENGAGKSTLMNILCGAINSDSGKITFANKKLDNITPEQSKELGIGFVQQELNLSEDLSVAENVYMGRLPTKNRILIDQKKLHHDTNEILKMLDTSFSSQTIVRTLTPANKQLVEIAKAISLNAKLLIFDEPTTSLSNKDVIHLFNIIDALKYKGVSSIYISHRMDEIFKLCDRLTVLRDGTYIDTVSVENTTENDVIRMMVGRELNDLFPKSINDVGEKVLEVEGLNDRSGHVKNVSFFARKGEVVGFSGLVGSGRTELMRLIFGADPIKEGLVKINGRETNINSPRAAIKNGICLLTEDRKNQGLALPLSIVENINLASMTNPIINKRIFESVADKYIESLEIRISNKHNSVSSLSGGNQQKVVLAKWLNTHSSILIFDEPTKGIDVGAKAAIYQLIDNLAKEGKTIIVVSSEIPELLGIADRVYVMCEGRITGELARNELDSEDIMKLSTIGGKLNE